MQNNFFETARLANAKRFFYVPEPFMAYYEYAHANYLFRRRSSELTVLVIFVILNLVQDLGKS